MHSLKKKQNQHHPMGQLVLLTSISQPKLLMCLANIQLICISVILLCKQKPRNFTIYLTSNSRFEQGFISSQIQYYQNITWKECVVRNHCPSIWLLEVRSYTISCGINFFLLDIGRTFELPYYLKEYIHFLQIDNNIKQGYDAATKVFQSILVNKTMLSNDLI